MGYHGDPNSLPENHNDSPIPDGLEILYSVFHIIGTIILGILVMIQIYNTYLDLHTAERKSLSHRYKMPKIDTWYKLAALFTVLHILSNFLSLLFFSVSYTTVSFCYWTLFFGVSFYFLAKSSMYSVFFIRLHQVYGNSACGYSKKLIIALIIVVHCFFIYNTSILITNKFDIVYFYDNDGKIPEYCVGILFIANIIVSLQDLICTIGSMIAFIIPLRKTIKMMGDNINEKVEAKMVFIGTKVTILSTAATISTIVFLGIIVMTNATLLQAVDEIMNALCLMFMTPYYPDNKFYQKYCCVCIACCDPKHRSYESKDIKNINDDNMDKHIEPTVINTNTETTTTTTTTNTTTETSIATAITMSSSNTDDAISVR